MIILWQNGVLSDPWQVYQKKYVINTITVRADEGVIVREIVGSARIRLEMVGSARIKTEMVGSARIA